MGTEFTCFMLTGIVVEFSAASSAAAMSEAEGSAATMRAMSASDSEPENPPELDEARLPSTSLKTALICVNADPAG